MPRDLSLAALQAMLAQSTDVVLVSLLEVNHASLSSPIRLVNNTEDIVSGGNTYTAAAFQATLPPDADKRNPTAQIVVSNVDQAMITALRTVTSAPTFTLSVVNAATPDTAEYGPLEMDLRDYEVSAQTIRMNLSQTDLTQEGFPYLKFDPPTFPGLF